MASTDRIDLASKACVLLGANQINSFDEETTEGLAVRTFYDLVYGSLIKHRNWTFAKRKVRLSELAEPADYGYRHVYRLDIEIVKLISLQNAASDFVLVSKRKIHTDIPNAFATALVLPDESLLPEDFKMAFIHMLAAAMATTITDDNSQAERFESKGALLIKQAGANDAMQSGDLSYSTKSTLIGVHGGGFNGSY
ncbi:head completion adaptor [Vibrio phage 1.254.O._10N.286.45.C8]|nr:head completion adaptor [Vibrio phage 1.254.O._10N.286.45.C8]